MDRQWFGGTENSKTDYSDKILRSNFTKDMLYVDDTNLVAKTVPSTKKQLNDKVKMEII